MRRLLFAAATLLMATSMAACTKKSAQQQPAPAATFFTTPEVKAIETALSSVEQQTRDAALVPELKGSSFPLGTKVVFDESTRKTGQHTATIEADVAGHGRWFVSLVRQAEQWQVWHTQKVTPGQSQTPRALGLPAAEPRMRLAGNTQANAQGCLPDIGKRVPVMFVHGFGGKAEAWGKKGDPSTFAGKVETNERYVDLFDYEESGLHWVDHPNIGPRLAERIACLAESSRQAGGPGKVIVVAHSMGGLATRFAAQTVNGRKVADDLGLIITIGTPHGGSVVSNWVLNVVRDICGGFVPPPLSLSLVPTREACAGLVESLTALGGLKVNAEKLKTLARFPTTSPVQAIAGDVRATFNLFGFTFEAKGSDLVVAVESALQGGTQEKDGGGVSVFSCTTTLPLPGITDADCEHGRLLNNPKVHDKVLASIEKYLELFKVKARPQGKPVTVGRMTVWIPEKWESLGSPADSDMRILPIGTPNCLDGCPPLGFKAYKGSQPSVDPCTGKPANKGTLNAGGKVVNYFEYCAGKSNATFVWEVPGEVVFSWSWPLPELNDILATAQWN